MMSKQTERNNTYTSVNDSRTLLKGKHEVIQGRFPQSKDIKHTRRRGRSKQIKRGNHQKKIGLEKDDTYEDVD